MIDATTFIGGWKEFNSQNVSFSYYTSDSVSSHLATTGALYTTLLSVYIVM